MTYYKIQQHPESLSPKRGRIILNLAIIFALVGLSVFYLAQINKLISKNFELYNFQKVLKQSQEKTQSLTVSLMQMRSLNSLEQAAKNLNLVIIEKANYLKITPGFFALSE